MAEAYYHPSLSPRCSGAWGEHYIAPYGLRLELLQWRRKCGVGLGFIFRNPHGSVEEEVC